MEQKELKITTKEDIPINAISFSSVNEPKGIIIICHGFGEHLKRYQEVAQYMTDRNYICIVFDQRGHGEMKGIPNNKRKKLLGVIPGYESFLDDIDIIKNEVMLLYPKVPIIMYGHSMGGNIAVNYLLRKGQKDITCAILETPWLRLYKPVKTPTVLLAKLLGKLNPNWAIINKLNLDHISRDKKRNAETEKDKVYHNRISFRLFSNISDAGESAIKNAVNLSVPTLLICAEDDKIVSPSAIKEFKSNAGHNVILKTYDGAYHSVHSDIIKEIYFQDIIKFLDKNCKV